MNTRNKPPRLTGTASPASMVRRLAVLATFFVCVSAVACTTRAPRSEESGTSESHTAALTADSATTATTTADTAPETHIVTTPGGAETGSDTQEPEPSDEATAQAPVFSLPGGILDAPTHLMLTLPAHAPDGAYIVYTTDGTEPTAQGTVYTTAIPLLNDGDGACTVIRAACFGGNGDPLGHIVTATYLKSEASTLRVVSLVTDPEHLYGTNGIFSDRSETGKAGERPVSVEIIEPNGEVLVRQDAAVRLSGAGSRSFDPANLRIIARKPESFADDAYKYSGTGKFRARLFAESECGMYDSFLLRCGGNDSLHQATGSFLRMNMLRDAVANNVCAQAESLLGGTVFAQYSTPVAVYINGEYYGMLHMKQDFDEHLIESLYGLPEEGVALLKGKKDGKTMYYKVEAGAQQDLSDWQTLCAFCAEHACAEDYAEAYRQVSEQLDVENFSRYFAVMLYLCNTDWPQNNTMVWRYTPTDTAPPTETAYADGKWRAVIRDMDLCFALHDKASQSSSTTYSMADTDTFYRITVFYRDGGYHYDASLGLYDDTMGFQGLFDFLMRSEDFRRIFREDCAVLCSDAFADLCRAEIDRFYTLMTPELPQHLTLWQTRGEIHDRYTLQHFLAAKEDMLEFINDRPGYFRLYMEQALAYYE